MMPGPQPDGAPGARSAESPHPLGTEASQRFDFKSWGRRRRPAAGLTRTAGVGALAVQTHAFNAVVGRSLASRRMLGQRSLIPVSGAGQLPVRPPEEYLPTAEDRHRVTVSPSADERRNRSFMQIQERMSGVRRTGPKALPIGLPRATSRASQSRMGRQTGPAGAAQRMVSEPAYISNPRDVGGAGRLVGPRDRLAVAPRNAAVAPVVTALQPPAGRITPAVGGPRTLAVQRNSVGDAPFPGQPRLTGAVDRGQPGSPFLGQRQLIRATGADPEVRPSTSGSIPSRAATSSISGGSVGGGGAGTVRVRRSVLRTGHVNKGVASDGPDTAGLIASGPTSSYPASSGIVESGVLQRGTSPGDLARAVATPNFDTGRFGPHGNILVTPLSPSVGVPRSIVGGGGSRASRPVAGAIGAKGSTASFAATGLLNRRQGNNLRDPLAASSFPRIDSPSQRHILGVASTGGSGPVMRYPVSRRGDVAGAPGTVASPIGQSVHSGVTAPLLVAPTSEQTFLASPAPLPQSRRVSPVVSRSLAPAPSRRPFLIAANRPITSPVPRQVAGSPPPTRGAAVQHVAAPLGTEAAGRPPIFGRAPEREAAEREVPKREAAPFRRVLEGRAPTGTAPIGRAPLRAAPIRGAASQPGTISRPGSPSSWALDRRPPWSTSTSAAKASWQERHGIGQRSGLIAPVVVPAGRVRLSRSLSTSSISEVALPSGTYLPRLPQLIRATAFAGDMATPVTPLAASALFSAARPAHIAPSSGVSSFPGTLAIARTAASARARTAAPVIAPVISPLTARSTVPTAAREPAPVTAGGPVSARGPASTEQGPPTHESLPFRERVSLPEDLPLR